MRSALSVCLPIVLICLGSQNLLATDYYVSPSGSDGNSGTSTASAWRTISKVNSVNFGAAARIFFQGGAAFSGRLYFNASDHGTATYPITISSYGSGRAVINGGNAGGFYAYNTAGLKLENINFVGSGGTVNTDFGVFFFLDLPNNVQLDTISLNNVDISGFGRSGLLIGSWNALSGYKNVRVTNVQAHNNGESGIIMYGYPNSVGYTLQNVYIAHSAAYNNPGKASATDNTGNGISIGNANGLVIEYCIAHDNGINNANAGGPIGIWAYDSNNVTIQYNESYKNRTSGGDGGGFDLDGGVTNSLMQYNYSHENDGAGFLFAQYSGARTWSGNTVRYNISENDARKNGYGAIMVWNGGSGIANGEVYNNIVYITPAASGQPRAVWVVTPTTNVHFRNNILVTTGGLYLADIATNQSGVSFDHNSYWASGSSFNFQWGNASHGLGELQLNPLLTSPGNGGTIGDTSQLGTLSEYKFLGGSPLINAGYDLAIAGIDPGSRDFFGSPIPQGLHFDIGAFESTASVSLPVISSFVASPSSILPGISSTLSWSVSGATSLSISPTVGTVTGLTQKAVTSSATTTYVLTATNSGGNTTASATVTVTTTPDTILPTMPTGLTGSVLSSSSVKVSWNASTDNVGVAGYKVFRNGALRTSLNALTYQDSGLSAKTTYSYSVAAYDAAGNTSVFTAPISLTTPSVPLPVISSFVANPSAIALGSSATLSWSVSGATSLSIGPIVGTVTGLTQKSVTPLLTTTYVLTATNSTGSITASATVTVTPDITPPTIPTGLTGTILSPSSVKVSWNASTDNVGVTGYKLFRNGVLRATLNALTYQDNGLTANTTYSYRVAAYDTAGNTSALSVALSVTPLVQGPWIGEYYTLLPSNKFRTLVFTRTDAAVNFNWGAGSPGAGVPVDDFGVRWTANLAVPQSRVYNFTVTSNDGVRMWIDGNLVLDSWIDQSATFTFSSSLTSGKHSFRVEYYDATGNANISVSWK